MADELKDQRIPIMMSPSEVKAIDDWAFARRIRSRGEAIRRLCLSGQYFDVMHETAILGILVSFKYETEKAVSPDLIEQISNKAVEFSAAIDEIKRLHLESHKSQEAIKLLDAAYQNAGVKPPSK